MLFQEAFRAGVHSRVLLCCFVCVCVCALLCFFDPRVGKMGARQAEGLQPRSCRAPQDSDQSSTNFVLFWVVILQRGSFFLSFFPFFWDWTSFIVRSQIGGGLARETTIFAFATPWKRGKPCPMSKKWERRKWDVQSQKNTGCPISDRALRSA